MSYPRRTDRCLSQMFWVFCFCRRSDVV
uniref:Uncharacterized protein n=1 Tax=Anguilla anguilla TaxID=7936 RepID=A0A0E9QQR9_ANGAN